MPEIVRHALFRTMDQTFSRDELLRHLTPLMHDQKHAEALQHMSDAQLRVIAEALDDLSKWKPDRRGEIRKPVMRRVQISPLEGSSFRPQQGLQEDISDHGIGVFLNRPIPVGTRIKIISHGQPDSSGTVRRCQQDKSGWAIGILMDPPEEPGAADTASAEPAPPEVATAPTPSTEPAPPEVAMAPPAAGDSAAPSDPPQAQTSSPE